MLENASTRFGRFEVRHAGGQLLADGVPIPLSRRAFEILELLLEREGGIVTKDEIFRRVWHGTVVDEGNLPVQISALRKALGEDRRMILTVSGRGYRLALERHATLPIETAAEAAPRLGPLPSGAELSERTNLPTLTSELVGRDAAVSDICGLFTRHRIVTLTGPGGIGKTRLGLEVARRLLPRFPDGIWLAELAPLVGENLLSTVVATALGLDSSGSAATPERIAQLLGDKKILLVLDNCEHVIHAATEMAEVLAQTNSNLRIMTTSREPLRAEGEHVYRVAPLDVPDEVTKDPRNLLQHGAVQLFLARVRAVEPRFPTDARTAELTAAVCRRLDGIPLAIELAAARAAGLGIEALAARLDDRFSLLTGGRRTALRRHQTLRATLDWSFELLSQTERVVLRRLSVFAGNFALEAAMVVAADADIGGIEVVDAVSNLVAKSLLLAEIGETTTLYRMLDTMRAYALEKCIEAGEHARTARHHAEFYAALFVKAEADWDRMSAAQWHGIYGWRTGNVRAALDWAFSPEGDADLGVALTIGSVPLWFRNSLMEECRERVRRALSALAACGGHDLARELHLHAALALALFFSRGAASETRATWEHTLQLAETLSDTEFELRALWGLWAIRLQGGEYPAALALAKRFFSLAVERAGAAEALVGERMIGQSLHYLGDQANARLHLERTHSRYAAPIHGSHILRFGYDQRVTAAANLAWVLWLQGYPEQARRLAAQAIEEAQAGGHALSLCYALAVAACPVRLWTGDLAGAETFVAMLLDHSTQHLLGPWEVWARCFDGAILVRRGELARGLRRFETALGELREAGYTMYYTTFLGELAEALGRSGRVSEGIAAVEEAIALSEDSGAHWWIAELLRIRGELSLLEGSPCAVAEAHFLRAIEAARQQGALSWELRAATSLAHLRDRSGRRAEARAALAPVYAQFTEGSGTIDLVRARQDLDAWA